MKNSTNGLAAFWGRTISLSRLLIFSNDRGFTMRAKSISVLRVIREKFLRQVLHGAPVLGLAVIIGLMTSVDARACASCGCTLSQDWENLQFAYTPGIRVDLRWDFLNQDQLRTGTGTITPVAASKVLNNGMPAEVEQYTINNYFTLGIDYSTTPDWGVNIQIPFIDRVHSTLGTESNGIVGGPGGGQYSSHTDSLGDIKILGRYQGFFPGCDNLGALFGIKLPTGNYTSQGSSTDPTAPGPVPIDRGLQPGTGTTDVIAGAYYTNVLKNYNWGYFAQVLGQAPLYSTDQYRPGDSISLNVGLRYLGFSGFSPQFQINYRAAERDSGANADIYNTGGVLLYLSPGVNVSVSNRFSVYGFFQLPIYQNLNGIQLAPYYTTSIGVRYVF
ncbi:MAG TPA: hypothetical protein DCP92_22090 [Nitrospiraceae bacterium]|jgi:hypothetical protein|nr:hypothetical protein [Nitrospiraceae bacterium]